jgi:hypothetical protein
MAVTINGDGTISGINVGGLPDGSVDSDTLATGIDATWANEYSVKNYISRNMTAASGDQDITGMGFQPSVVYVMAGSGGQADLGSVGWSDFTKQACLYSEATNYPGQRNLNNTCTVWMVQSSSGITQKGTVTALTDGVRITWTKQGSPASHAFWICVMGVK